MSETKEVTMETPGICKDCRFRLRSKKCEVLDNYVPRKKVCDVADVDRDGLVTAGFAFRSKRRK